jgi:hypothetical protein
MNSLPTDPNCDLNNPASIPASTAGQILVGPGDVGEVKLETLVHLQRFERELWRRIEEGPATFDIVDWVKTALIGVNDLRGESREGFEDIQEQLKSFDNAEDHNEELAAVREIKAIVERHL